MERSQALHLVLFGVALYFYPLLLLQLLLAYAMGYELKWSDKVYVFCFAVVSVSTLLGIPLFLMLDVLFPRANLGADALALGLALILIGVVFAFGLAILCGISVAWSVSGFFGSKLYPLLQRPQPQPPAPPVFQPSSPSS